jgi:hypothetical protein
LIALVALAAVALVSCAKLGSGGTTSLPADIYSAGPSLSDVRTLLGDANWWPGPPSFGVRPLDAETTSYTQLFSITQRYVHVGSAEQFLVHYAVFDKTSSATTQMTNYQNAFGASPTSPKEGDQVLYYGLGGSGGAPYITRTFVRLGQIVAQIIWSRKDGIPTAAALGKNAARVVDGLKRVTTAKVRPSVQAVDQKLLPPPGLDITFLGAARLAVEAWLVMENIALPEAGLQLMQTDGINDFVFGDYALNNDTHMEVRSSLMTFPTAAAAAGWAGTFSSATPDQSGIANSYVNISGGVEGAGEYHYFFVSGQYGGMLVCRPTIEGEAATRTCEGPMERTAISWKIALGG